MITEKCLKCNKEVLLNDLNSSRMCRSCWKDWVKVFERHCTEGHIKFTVKE